MEHGEKLAAMIQLREEEHGALLEEYRNRRDALLDSLYQQVKAFNLDSSEVAEKNEEITQKLSSNLLVVAKRHEGYQTLWNLCSDHNDLELLRSLMHHSRGPKGGFSNFVFKQMYNNKQFSKLMRLGEEFPEELATFLKEHPDLLWLYEIFLNQFSSASETLHVHGAWLPPWLAARLVGFQSYVESHWEEHGKPSFELLKQKTLEKKTQAEKWVEPHVKTIKTKWVPATMEQWVIVTTNVEPQLQSLTKKTKEVYIQSKDALTPHMIKIKEAIDPHFQICSPYIDQIATATKPHLDKARETVAPYTKEAVIAYGKFLESATKYHDQVPDMLQSNQVSKKQKKRFTTVDNLRMTRSKKAI